MNESIKRLDDIYLNVDELTSTLVSIEADLLANNELYQWLNETEEKIDKFEKEIEMSQI